MPPELLASIRLQTPDCIFLVSVAHGVSTPMTNRDRGESSADIGTPKNLWAFVWPVRGNFLRGNPIPLQSSPLRPIIGRCSKSQQSGQQVEAQLHARIVAIDGGKSI